MKRLLTASAGTVLSVLAVIPFPALVQAQATPQEPTSQRFVEQTTPEDQGLDSCFDYYKFGSVPVTLQTDTSTISQGGQITFKGVITNQNAYPIDDAKIYAKIFYEENFEKNSFGPDIVDWFVLQSDINLKAGETKNVTYTWNVPPNTKPGNYGLATYVASHDRFNYFGLSFSTDVVGSLNQFKVAGTDVGSVRFNNKKVIFSGHGYHTAIFAPQLPMPDESGVPISVPIENTTQQSFEGKVQWQLYSWDGINPDHLIMQSDENVSVAAGASTTVSYNVKDTSHSVYYVIGTLTSKDPTFEKSIITVRYISSTRDGTDQPRIAELGTTGYPSTADSATKAFACFHSSGTVPSDGVTMKITAKPLDPISWLLHLGSIGSRTWNGRAPGQVSALAMPLTAASNNFSVTATLSQDGTEIDSVTSTYSCETFSNGCTFVQKYGWILIGGIAVVLVLAAIGIIMFLLRKPKRVDPIVSEFR